MTFSEVTNIYSGFGGRPRDRRSIDMPDNIVFTVFIILSFLSVAFGSVAAFFAYKNSHKVEHELRMVFWGIGAIAGFVFGALCWAWFLIPIIINHL